MNKNFAPIVSLCVGLACTPTFGADIAVAEIAVADIAVEGGTASFVVSTNMPAISVKGKSTALQAHARVQHTPEGLHIEQIEATIPVKSILTGMSIRDEHMRRYIFTTGDGKIPDLRFEADSAACGAPAGKNGESTCQLTGTLAIRGVPRAFTIPLKLHADGTAFRASGDATVKLSDYGIQQPSQFGVRTSNEIQLHLEFTGKEAPAAIASGGRR